MKQSEPLPEAKTSQVLDLLKDIYKLECEIMRLREGIKKLKHYAPDEVHDLLFPNRRKRVDGK